MRGGVLSLRKSPGVVLALVMAALAGLLAAATPAAAKSYRHPTLRQTVTVLPDGTLDILDVREYEFDGQFRNAFLTVEPIEGGRVEFSGVAASDGKAPVENVRIEGNTLRWQYDARNETRAFAIRYRLTGEVEKSSDAALIDRRFLEDEHAPIDLYELSFNLGGPADLLKVFIVTEMGRVGELDVRAEEGKSTMTIEALRRDEWVRARVLFDEARVPDLAGLDEPRYETWLHDTALETRAYREGMRERLAGTRGADRAPRKPLPTAVAPLFLVAAGLFCAWTFRTWKARGTEPTVADIGLYFREPAEAVPPAVVPYVLEQMTSGAAYGSQAFGATLLDFARRGFLRLEEREKPSFLGLGGGREVDFILAKAPAPGELQPFEAEVWGLLDAARREDDRVTPKELEKYFEKRTTWMMTWGSTLRDWYESTKGPLLEGNHALWMFLSIFGGIVLMTGLILAGVFSNNRVVFITAILSGVTAGLFGIVCGAGMPRWRPEALSNARKWKAYRKFLADFSAMEEAPAEHYKLWDYHFIYATALGVSKQYLGNLKKLMAREPDRFATPAWIMAGSDPLGAAGAASRVEAMQANLAALEANLSALESALTTSTSSGGGFSGGGAGGSSGGGGSGAS
jgi:uncharacterized membrane protein YgcG